MKVLVTPNISDKALTYLKSSCDVRISAGLLPTDSELSDCEALQIRSRTKITAGLLAQAKQLKVIVTATSGFDHIDLHACQQANVTVMHTPTANAQSAAELATTLMMLLHRPIHLYDQGIRQGLWRDQFQAARLLGESHLGIVGLGRIGRRVAMMAKAFGMNMSFYDPYVSQAEAALTGLAIQKEDDLHQLFSHCDVVSLHVPRTTKTSGMINSEVFSHAQDLRLINTCRGDVVVEDDLCAALDKGQIAACGLDVFESEPLSPTSKLRASDRPVVFSPHAGAFTEHAFDASSLEAAEKVVKFLSENEISDPLPPATAWAKDIPIA